MSSLAKVSLWGRTIGAVSLDDNSAIANFQYDPEFAQSGIEVSPVVMPLSNRIYSFGQQPRETFHGLPGLLADSLPDRFGNALINTWLASQGRTADSFNAVERLCYIGARGMGALEFAPVIGPNLRESEVVKIDALVELASQVLSERNRLHENLADEEREHSLRSILRVGTSAGGARAKAVIAWNRQSNEVRSGQVNAGEGFEYWLLKFDGVRGNQDKELEDPRGYGAIEFAYANMARDAGIEISECRLLEENGRRHFMTKRFDRRDNGEKIHMQSLGAMAHFDFNAAGAYSYEQALQIIRQLGLPMQAIEQQFLRMVFNIVARNQDDHVKNIAFLMDKAGRWTLSPAFDICYSYNPDGAWTSSHQMSVNQKRDHFTREDLRVAAKNISMAKNRADALLDQVLAVVRNWKQYAADAGISDIWAEQIFTRLRLEWV